MSSGQNNRTLDLEKRTLHYSAKNIPLPSEDNYLKKLIIKTEKFIKNLRWRTFFYLNPDLVPAQIETYGFPSPKSPPYVQELKEFENGIAQIVENIKFKKAHNTFQTELKNDVREIRTNNNLLVPADKSNNFYHVTPTQYNELLEKSIQKDYKKIDRRVIDDIYTTDRKIAESLLLSDRIKSTTEKQAFITLKDHKENFKENPTCRLINPCKPELGKVSKQILERIVNDVKSNVNLNLWRSTREVINWFDSTTKNNKHSFISFDVCEFYPSINETLLDNAISFASQYTTISSKNIEIIKHTKNTFLFNNNSPWSKKNSTFDVTMGSYDGAETCELVGLFLLSKLKHLKIDCGLYRDDGLAICDLSPRQVEQTKKEICKIFKTFGLNLTIVANKKIVNFLDVTLNLTTNTYQPFVKENNTPLYINKKSNHPPSIIKNLPRSINDRISTNSKNETIFNKASAPFADALKKSGFNYKMKFDNGSKTPTNTETENENVKEPNTSTQTDTSKKNKRKRNITWFNPPYSANVATNIGKEFLTLIDKCFPKSNKLHKLINRSNIKLSYSCMPNIEQVITNHNKSVLQKANNDTHQPTKTCNCRNRDACPLRGNCLDEYVVYKATVTQKESNKQETYIGLTSNSFKTRYNQHTSSFKLNHKRSTTTLSEHIWSLKDKNIVHNTTWDIVKKLTPPKSNGTCQLCLEEKFAIIRYAPTLNKRTELFTSCLHRKKAYIAASCQGQLQYVKTTMAKSPMRGAKAPRN